MFLLLWFLTLVTDQALGVLLEVETYDPIPMNTVQVKKWNTVL